MKVEPVEGGWATHHFYCPGCKTGHGFDDKRWEFNGDLDKPTISPSLLVTHPYKGVLQTCHSFIKEGMIQFLGDCTHELANQTVPLPEL